MTYLLFFLFALGSVGRLSFVNQTVNIYLYELVLAPYLLYLLAKYGARPYKEHLKHLKYIYWFLAAAAATLILSLIRFEPHENTVAALYLARLTMYLAGLPLLIHHFKDKSRHIHLTYSFLLYFALTAVYSIIQYAYYPNLRNLEYLGWDPHQYRIFGTVFDTSTASALYGLILLFLITHGKKILTMKYMWPMSLVLYGAIGALTYARGFYLAFTVTMLYYLTVVNKQFVKAAYMIVIIIGIIILIPKPAGESANLTRTFTIQSRAADYQVGFQIWEGNPLFGIGYNHLRYAKPEVNDLTANHAAASLTSSFLIILATMGVLGLIPFILMIYKLAQTSSIALYTLVFLSAFSLSDNILLHPLVLFMEIFIIAWGITSRTSR